jgi:hypothetical protein
MNHYENKYELDMYHDNLLTQGVNYLEQMSNWMKVAETNGSVYIKMKDYTSSSKFRENISNVLQQLEEIAKYIFMSIIGILLNLIVYVCLKFSVKEMFKRVSCVKCCRNV